MPRATSSFAPLAVALALLPLACAPGAGEPELTAEAAAPPGSKVVACARTGPGREQPLDASGSSSTVALVRSGNRTLAYIADEDDRSVRTIDVDMGNELAVTPVAGAPAALLVLGDGRVVVSIRDRERLEVLEPPGDPGSPLARRCSVPVATEPTGLALTHDGKTVLVVSRWAHAITGLDAATLALRFGADLPRDPRSVVASGDGTKAFVGHVVGSRISVVDLEGDHRVRAIDLHDRQKRDIFAVEMGGGRDFRAGPIRTERRDQRADQGFALVRTAAGHILAPEAMVDTGNGVRSRGYGEGQSAFGDVAAIDEKTEKRVQAPAFGGLADDCLLPRGAAVDAGDGKLLVACYGIDAVVAYDATANAPHDKELRRYQVGVGPSGVAVDDGHRAVTWSQLERRVGIIDLRRRKGNPLTFVAVAGEREPPRASVARGRQLFHTTAGRRISFDGRACASCHPDGRDDGFTWTTPEGPRQTPMLVGRLEGSAPYGWSGVSKDLAEHVKHTLDRLAGTGITAREQDDVFAYVATLRTPESVEPEGEVIAARFPLRPASGDPLVIQGDALFHAAETGCSSCHLGDDLTDHARHDVKSRAPGDGARAFDTPSLRFVGHSAPYYHDGRFATLADLLRGTDGKMGHTAHLSGAERDALAAYLGSL